MANSVNLVVFPVKDLDKAKSTYTTLLGVEPYMANAYYAGYRLGDVEVGLDPNGFNKGQTAALAYVTVADLGQALAAMQAAGASVQQQPTDVGGGRRVATVKDADGNVVGLMQNP